MNRLLLILLITVAVLIIGVAVFFIVKTPAEKCEADTDCSSGYTCVEGKCRKPSPPSSGCKSDSECSPGYTCSLENECIKDGDWEGFASTTVYDAEQQWPGGGSSPNISLCAIRNGGGVGSAVPWPFILQRYPSRTVWLNSIIANVKGESKSKDCFLVQAIKQNPFNEDGKIIIDPNNSDIAKTDDGNEYETFVVIPYEGCGGNCNTDAGVPDCFNSCPDIQTYIAGGQPESPGDTCKYIQSYKDDGWMYNDKTYDNLIKEKIACPAILSSYTDYGKDEIVPTLADFNKQPGWNCGAFNWCSANFVHFDMDNGSPLWKGFLDKYRGKLAEIGADTNIFVRYKRINWTDTGKSPIDINYITSCPFTGTTIDPTGCAADLPDGQYCIKWTNYGDDCKPTTTSEMTCACAQGQEFNKTRNECYSPDDKCYDMKSGLKTCSADEGCNPTTGNCTEYADGCPGCFGCFVASQCYYTPGWGDNKENCLKQEGKWCGDV